MKNTWLLPILFLALTGCPSSNEKSAAEDAPKHEKRVRPAERTDEAEPSAAEPSEAEENEAGQADESAAADTEDDADARVPIIALNLEGYPSGRLTYVGATDGKRTEFLRELSKEGTFHSATKSDRNDKEFFQAGDALYILEGERCQLMRGEQAKEMGKVVQAIHGFGAASMAYPFLFKGVEREALTRTGSAEVAGRDATEYAVDASWEVPLNVVTGKGKVWLDDETKRPLRSEGKVTIKAAIGDDPAKVFDWKYEAKDLGEDVEVALPAACRAEDEKAAEMAALPRLEGAKEVMAAGPMSMYEAPGTVAEAYDFYVKKLTAAGWTLEQQGHEGDEAGIQARKGEDGMAVAIEKEGDGVRVTLVKQK